MVTGPVAESDCTAGSSTLACAQQRPGAQAVGFSRELQVLGRGHRVAAGAHRRERHLLAVGGDGRIRITLVRQVDQLGVAEVLGDPDQRGVQPHRPALVVEGVQGPGEADVAADLRPEEAVLLGARRGLDRRRLLRRDEDLGERQAPVVVGLDPLARNEEHPLVQAGRRGRGVLHLALGDLDQRGAEAEREQVPGIDDAHVLVAPHGARWSQRRIDAMPASEYGSDVHLPWRSRRAPRADSHSASASTGTGGMVDRPWPSHVSALWRTSMWRSPLSSDARNGVGGGAGRAVAPGGSPTRAAPRRSRAQTARTTRWNFAFSSTRPSSSRTPSRVCHISTRCRGAVGADGGSGVGPSAEVARRDDQPPRRLDRRLGVGRRPAEPLARPRHADAVGGDHEARRGRRAMRPTARRR